jgi:ubiquinone/menaquinone biosynthesis C-methylase UbiE
MGYPNETIKPLLIQQETELDRIRVAYAKRQRSAIYSLFDPAQLLMIQELERMLLKLLSRHGYQSLEKVRILEVGCGTGHWLQEFVAWGARPENIAGVDLLPERIAEAKHLCPSGVTLECGNAAALNHSSSMFDLVLQSTVFTSILDQGLKQRMASEILRVLRPGGFIIWYDFFMSNPRNLDVRGVKRREISQLFPGCRVCLRRVTLAPPIGRLVAPISPLLYRALASLRAFCTHYLGLIEKL